MNVWVVVASTIFASSANIVMSALKAERVKPKRLCAFVSWVLRAKAGAQSQDLALGCRWVCACVSTHRTWEHGEVQGQPSMCFLKSHHVSETGFLTGLKFTGWLGAGQQAPGTSLSLIQYWGYKHIHHV